VLPPRAVSKASRASAMGSQLRVTGGVTQHHGQEGSRPVLTRRLSNGLDAVLGFLCHPACPGPRLTGRELEVAGLVAGWLADQGTRRRDCSQTDGRDASHADSWNVHPG